MGKSIITVDNSATLRKMVSFILKGVGHTVYEAEDGAEAVKVIETKNIHIIITDFQKKSVQSWNHNLHLQDKFFLFTISLFNKCLIIRGSDWSIV